MKRMTRHFSIALAAVGLFSAALRAEEPPAQPGDAARQAAELLRELRTLESEIEQRTVSEETLKRQQQILELWDRLLASAGPASPPPAAPQQPMPAPQNQTQPQPSPTRSPEGDAEPGERTPAEADTESPRRKENPDQPADRSTEVSEQRRPVDPSQLQSEERERLMRNVWGNLPEHVRQRLLNASDEKYLPRYETRIRDYFRSLSEEKSSP